MFQTIITTFTFCVLATSGLAFCSEPSFFGSAPSFNSFEPNVPALYVKPSVPFCLNSYRYSGKHTCSQWELDNYFDEVSSYIDELNRYVRDTQEFADDAVAFANQAITFANDIEALADHALGYARCEAEQVKSQHE